MKKLRYLAVSLAGLMSPTAVVLAQYDFRGTFGTAFQGNRIYGAGDVIGIIESIGGFLIIAGGILAAVAIVVSGIMWMTAGSNQTRVAGAKTFFKNAVIGALILFAAGIIVNTIILLALDPFQFFS